jgi:eukaryotic-like serine/threonine-protein kinase
VETLAEGATLDHYRILANLGQGAFSTAYEARDERNGRVVVLKCPNPVLLGDTTALDRFRREMAIGRRLKHPNIMEALDDGQSRSAPYLVVEYVDGESFASLLRRRGRLSPEEAAGYTRQILAALEYAHGQRVYHRDLKPSNMLVDTSGRLKIIDFGIAYMAGVRRLTWRWAGSALGTPDYMSPEQIQGRRGDNRSDLYATGAILYEMLTGSPPFDGNDIAAVMKQHLEASPSKPSRYNGRVPSGLDGIVLKALRKNPEERYQSAAEFAADLDRYGTLQLGDFNLPPERALEGPHPDRLLAIVAAGLAGGFVALSAAILAISHLLSHH